MSYMREPYVWSDGVNTHVRTEAGLGEVSGFGESEVATISNESLEELAVVVVAEMLMSDDEGIAKVLEVAKRADKRHGGNFGADGNRKLLGLETSLEGLLATTPANPGIDAREMLNRVCAAVLAGLRGGEKTVHVTMMREVPAPMGRFRPEFIIVNGFECASETCGRPHHVKVLASGEAHEYPDHAAHS